MNFEQRKSQRLQGMVNDARRVIRYRLGGEKPAARELESLMRARYFATGDEVRAIIQDVAVSDGVIQQGESL